MQIYLVSMQILICQVLCISFYTKDETSSSMSFFSFPHNNKPYKINHVHLFSFSKLRVGREKMKKRHYQMKNSNELLILFIPHKFK